MIKSKLSKANFSHVNKFLSVMGKVKRFSLKNNKLVVVFNSKTKKVYVSFDMFDTRDFHEIFKMCNCIGFIEHMLVKNDKFYIRYRSIDNNLLLYKNLKSFPQINVNFETIN